MYTDMLDIVVCMKQVLDPEAPVSAFQIDSDGKRAIPPKGTPPVLNPYDENALEAALSLRDTRDVRITVLSMGHQLALPVVKKALSVGADELMLLQDQAFADLDGIATAHVLTAAIRKIGKYDIILCGIQASDTDAGVVGSGIAELMGIPSVTWACSIESVGEGLRIVRLVNDGYEIIESQLPVLVTVRSEIGELRSASLEAIIAARKKEATVWGAQDLGIDAGQLSLTKLVSLYRPVRESHCEIITGQTEEESAINLAITLREAGLL
jgi:electron transfer flavoprotein beta subunit